jgi:hypothetical protein
MKLPAALSKNWVSGFHWIASHPTYAAGLGLRRVRKRQQRSLFAGVDPVPGIEVIADPFFEDKN